MNTKDFIDSEKQRLQTLFRLFNRDGSVLTVSEKGVSEPMVTLADSYIVTRVAPSFDAKGEHVKTDFWLLWKAVGYTDSSQFTHTIKVVAVSVSDEIEEVVEGEKRKVWLSVDLTDDRGRRHRIEAIEPGQEPDLADDWREWLSFKNGNLETVKMADERILCEHIRIAEEWE